MALKDHEETRRLFGVIAEALRSEIHQVAEGVAMTNEAMERLRGEFQELRVETAGEFKAVRAGMAGGLKAVRAEMAGEFKAVRAETARGFADVRGAVAGAYSDVDRRLRVLEGR